MLTIPNAVEEVIKKKPFLEGALVEGLVNLSALARQLKPDIEKKVGRPVNDSAVIMALNRLVPRLELMSAHEIQEGGRKHRRHHRTFESGRLCFRQFADPFCQTGTSAGAYQHDEGCFLYLFTGNL